MKKKVSSRPKVRQSSIFAKAAKNEAARVERVKRGIITHLRRELSKRDQEISRLKEQLKKARK